MSVHDSTGLSRPGTRYAATVIVVTGVPEWWVEPDGRGRAAGTAVDVARAAVADGARVELVGRVGDDPTGDALLLDLAAAGVGHVAVLRDPARATPMLGVSTDDPLDEDPFADAEAPSSPAAPSPPTAPARPVLDAADVELGLRYLVDYGVIVVAETIDAAAQRVVADAARFAPARLVVIVPAGAAAADDLAEATVFEAPPVDPDGAFGAVVGSYAAALDRGTDPAAAFDGSLAGRGWEPAEA